jgi:DNA-binding transcriptional MerR regulator
MNYYSVKQISNLAGVSIKTLHHYEKIGILNPKFKTDANYRYNTETKLLRLQQILIFKELGFSLKEISKILDSKKFELIESLKKQQKELQKKSNLIRNMFHTVEKTIQYLKKGKNMKHDELYEGLGKEFGNKLRKKAIQKWGEESISNSEDYLSSLTKKDFGNLKNEFHSTWKKLFRLKKEDPNSKIVQLEVKKFYILIGKFWGIKNPKENCLDRFKNLGDLYIEDESYTFLDNRKQPEFAKFLKSALDFFEG